VSVSKILTPINAFDLTLADSDLDCSLDSESDLGGGGVVVFNLEVEVENNLDVDVEMRFDRFDLRINLEIELGLKNEVIKPTILLSEVQQQRTVASYSLSRRNKTFCRFTSNSPLRLIRYRIPGGLSPC
jgi:hypothetical protein